MSYGTTDMAIEASDNTNDLESEVKNSIEKLSWIKSDDYDSFGDGGARIAAVSLTDTTGQPLNKLTHSRKVNFYIKFQVFQDIYSAGVGLVLKDRLSNSIFTINSYMYDAPIEFLEKNSIHVAHVSFYFPYLSKGDYTISVALSEGTQDNHIQHHWVHDIYHINYLSDSKTNEVAAVLALEKGDIEITYKCLT